MPTGIEETIAAVVEKVAEASTEAMEEASEAIPEISAIQEVPERLAETKEAQLTTEVTEYSRQLAEHDVAIEDVRDAVSEARGKGLTRQTELLGDRLSRAELEKRGNVVLQEQPQYAVNPKTDYPYRADYLVETRPGSTFREVVRVGDETIVREHVAANKEKLLIDVKNHSLDSFRRNLPDTIEKVQRMSEIPDTSSVISLPEDVALNKGASDGIRQIWDAGGTVITHAPYEATMRLALRIHSHLL